MIKITIGAAPTAARLSKFAGPQTGPAVPSVIGAWEGPRDFSFTILGQMPPKLVTPPQQVTQALLRLVTLFRMARAGAMWEPGAAPKSIFTTWDPAGTAVSIDKDGLPWPTAEPIAGIVRAIRTHAHAHGKMLPWRVEVPLAWVEREGSALLADISGDDGEGAPTGRLLRRIAAELQYLHRAATARDLVWTTGNQAILRPIGARVPRFGELMNKGWFALVATPEVDLSIPVTAWRLKVAGGEPVTEICREVPVVDQDKFAPWWDGLSTEDRKRVKAVDYPREAVLRSGHFTFTPMKGASLPLLTGEIPRNLFAFLKKAAEGGVLPPLDLLLKEEAEAEMAAAGIQRLFEALSVDALESIEELEVPHNPLAAAPPVEEEEEFDDEPTAEEILGAAEPTAEESLEAPESAPAPKGKAKKVKKKAKA